MEFIFSLAFFCGLGFAAAIIAFGIRVILEWLGILKPRAAQAASPTNVTIEVYQLRDEFAGKAMQALLSSCDVSARGYNTELNRRAAQAYAMADAMLAAREKGGA